MPIRFDEDLGRLKARLLSMGALAGEMIDDTLAALESGDLALFKPVIETEETLDGLQRQIDEETIRLIGVYTPVAADLRFLLMVTRINAELERIGDETMNISFYTKRLLKEAPLRLPDTIRRMGETVKTMLETTMRAFAQGSSELALEVVQTDDQVDDLNDETCKRIISGMRTDSVTPVPGLELVLIARAFERIGDQAENIAEDVYYLVEGRDIRHRRESQQADS